MYAASIEGLSADERARFDDGLHLRARPAVSGPRRALSAVPAIDPERISPERIAAIRALGGDVTMSEGA